MAARNSGRMGAGVAGDSEDASLSAIGVERITASYVEQARAVIRTRLAQAGARLGWFLNQTFSKEPATRFDTVRYFCWSKTLLDKLYRTAVEIGPMKTILPFTLVFTSRNECTDTQLSAEAFTFLVCGIIEPPLRTVNRASSFSKSTGFRRCASKPASRARSSSRA